MVATIQKPFHVNTCVSRLSSGSVYYLILTMSSSLHALAVVVIRIALSFTPHLLLHHERFVYQAFLSALLSCPVSSMSNVHSPCHHTDHRPYDQAPLYPNRLCCWHASCEMFRFEMRGIQHASRVTFHVSSVALSVSWRDVCVQHHWVWQSLLLGVTHTFH